jgi:catechol 2,3-dioxygenase-like lactoylglutathione lyase family enzyme
VALTTGWNRVSVLAPRKVAGGCAPHRGDVDKAHVAYDVDNIDAVLAAAAKPDVRPIGEFSAVNAGPKTGMRVVYLRNPDGVTIELIEKPSA